MDFKRFPLPIITSVFGHHYVRTAASDATTNWSKAPLVFPGQNGHPFL